MHCSLCILVNSDAAISCPCAVQAMDPEVAAKIAEAEAAQKRAHAEAQQAAEEALAIESQLQLQQEAAGQQVRFWGAAIRVQRIWGYDLSFEAKTARCSAPCPSDWKHVTYSLGMHPEDICSC